MSPKVNARRPTGVSDLTLGVSDHWLGIRTWADGTATLAFSAPTGPDRLLQTRKVHRNLTRLCSNDNWYYEVKISAVLIYCSSHDTTDRRGILRDGFCDAHLHEFKIRKEQSSYWLRQKKCWYLQRNYFLENIHIQDIFKSEKKKAFWNKTLKVQISTQSFPNGDKAYAINNPTTTTRENFSEMVSVTHTCMNFISKLWRSKVTGWYLSRKDFPQTSHL